MKPTLFISSTIHDFRDLRSSIKWWLEENEYKVNASEFNDFDKPLDSNSYESCLRAIDNSDYFILLMGERFGGLYDSQISITQMEYRYAYERMAQGKIKLINFVRQDLLTKMDEYKTHIKGTSIDINLLGKEDKEKHRIFLFLEEVKRIDDMKSGLRPKGNWLHQFNGFSDIVSVIKNQLGDRISLNYKSKRFIICQDLKLNLKALLVVDEKRELYPRGFISKKLFGDFVLDLDKPMIKLTAQQQINLGIFYISSWQTSKMSLERIESFYNEGFFLEYDKDVDDYVSKDLNIIATSLLNYYNLINGLHTTLYSNYSENIINLSKKPSGELPIVNATLIMNAIRFCEAVQNCVQFSKALYKNLNHIKSPVPKRQENLEIYPKESLATSKELPTDDEILALLKD